MTPRDAAGGAPSPGVEPPSGKGAGPGRPAGAPPDRAQRDRIASDLTTNILVEAAAGTGKTASMLERMVALLRSGRCRSIATMAAVTFTRKAASELRTRFQVKLESEVAAASGAERERLETALANIDQCFIGTIHSFCGRLLRERPVEARVDLAFREIEPEEDARLRKQAWDDYAARLIAGESPDIVDGLRELGLTIADLEQTFMRFADFPDVDEWPVPPPEITIPAPGPYIKAARDYAAHMRDCGELPDDPPPPSGGRRLVEEYSRLPRLVARSDFTYQPDLIAVLEALNTKPPSMSNGVKKQGWGTWAKEEQTRWKEFNEAYAEPYLAAVRMVRYRLALKAMLQARELYDAERIPRGKLNFQDLLMKAAALLRDKPHVRMYFAGRFTHLLVDEFQDTDPIQAQVMLYLTATDATETDWKRCRPRPGALFVVGDPKQSIYRFRRADIVTYNEVKRIIADSGGLVLELSANFRATGCLIDWTNLAFAAHFPPEATDQSPAYVELQLGREAGLGVGPSGVNVLEVPADLCKKAGGAVGLAWEADLIARAIRCALDGGEIVERAGEDEPGPAVPGDFMVISYNKKQLSAYARALQEYGVPHRVSGGKALNEVWELKLLHACLDAVAQPDNPVALIAALRSELFGVSDAALYAFKKAGGRFDYNTGVPDSLEETLARPIATAFAGMRRYAGWLSSMPPVAAVERTAADLGLMVLAASREGGDVQAGSVAKAIELLRGVQDEMPTTAQLVDYLGEIVDAEAESEGFDGISAVPSGEDVVRVMNLHKAKGLQAPVVFLAGHRTATSGIIDTYIDRSGERTRGYLQVMTKKGNATFKHAVPQGWDEVIEVERRFQDAETTRLVYVAVTRAETMLVVTRQSDGKARSIWSLLEPQMVVAPLLEEPGQPEIARAHGTPVTTKAVKSAADAIDARVASLEAPTFAARAAKEYALSADFVPVEGSLISFGEPEPGATAHVPEGEHGIEWGEAVHTVLDFAMKSGGADLEQIASAALEEAGIEATRLGDLVETVESVLSSEIWERARGASRCLTEAPFAVALDGGEGDGPLLVRGSIDLAFEEEGGWVIVDYKTDSPPASGDLTELSQRYAPQLELYSKAFEKCTGEQVKERALFFIRAGTTVSNM